MRIKKGFVLRKVMDNYVVVAVGEASRSFHGMVKLNASAAEIWKYIEDGQSRDAIIDAMLEKYDASRDVVEHDLDKTLSLLSEHGMIEI